jgi:hypothetical protein
LCDGRGSSDEKNHEISKKQMEAEENIKEQLDVNNLITSDIDQAKNLHWGFHEFWTSVISIILCFCFIGYKLKMALLFAAGFLIVLNVINFFVTKKMLFCFEIMSMYKDKRIALSSDVIQGIKSIKYLSWEEIFERRIAAIRKLEFKHLSVYKGLDVVLGVLWNYLPTLMLFLTLTWYVYEGNKLEDANVMTVNYRNIVFFQFKIFFR